MVLFPASFGLWPHKPKQSTLKAGILLKDTLARATDIQDDFNKSR